MNHAVDKLEHLLARVKQRRSEPRGGAARPRVEAPRAEPLETAFSAPPPPTGRMSRAPVPTPLEESMEQVVPVERAREPPPQAFAESAPPPRAPIDEFELDDFESASALTIQPGPAPAPAASEAPITVLPAAQPQPAALLRAATQRIAPAAVAQGVSPVVASSEARHFEPQTFGELLEQSLALRPAK